MSHRTFAAFKAASRPFVSRPRTSVEPLERRALLAFSGSPFVQVAHGFDLGEMVADRTQNVVYALDRTNNKVLAVNTDQGRTVAHAAVAGQPTALAVSPDGSEIFVSSTAADTVQVYSLPNLSLTRTLTIDDPTRLTAVTGDRLIVGRAGQFSAARQVDANNGAVLSTFGSFYSGHFLTNAAGTTLYASEIGLSTTGTDAYDVSNPNATPSYLRNYDTRMSNGRDVALDERYNRLYGMAGGVYGVNSVDLASNARQLWSFWDGAAYGTSVAVTDAQPYVYAGSQDPYRGGVFVYDRATGGQISHFLPSGQYKTVWDLAVTPNGHVLYKADPEYSIYADMQVGLIGGTSLALTGMPVARATATTSERSLSVQFDASASETYFGGQSIANYAWNFGDGTTATGATPTHAYASPGTYMATLTATASNGLSDAFTLSVTVEGEPFATLDRGVLRVRGTSGNDAIALSNNYAGTLTATLNGQSLGFSYNSVSRVEVDAGAGDDAVSLGMAFFKPVSVDGGVGADALTFEASEGDDLITLAASSVEGGGNRAIYANVEALTVNGRFGYDTFRVDAATPGTRYALNGGDGDDTFFARDNAINVIDGGDGLDRAIVERDDVVTNVESIGYTAARIASATGSNAVDEGRTFTITLGYDVAGVVPDAWQVDWGDGTVETLAGGSLTAGHVYADGPGTRTVVAKATRNGIADASEPLVVTVRNVAPTATFAQTGPAAEGAAATLAFSDIFDAPADLSAGLRFSFDFNNDGDFTDAGDVANATTPRASFTFADSGTFAVRGRITDKDGGYRDYVTSVIVANVAPTVVIAGPDGSSKKNEPKRKKPMSFTFAVVDPSPADAAAGYTYEIDWDGDGRIDQTIVGGATVDLKQRYNDAGIYNVTVRVIDKDGGVGTASFLLEIA